jgi:phosphoglycerate dehydrogenase-like enzyme
MKPTAHLVNIGRGRTVDEAALVRALETNRIAGAGMDTFATEPLPTDSKLWEMPNVIISPHVAGGGEDTGERGTEQFCENLRRYLDKKKMINVIDKKRGY